MSYHCQGLSPYPLEVTLMESPVISLTFSGRGTGVRRTAMKNKF